MYTACFSYRNKSPYIDNLSAPSRIFDKLARRDVQAVTSFQCERAFSERGVSGYELSPSGERKRWLGSLPLANIEVLVNRMGRSIKKDLVPNAAVLPPMINENATRSLAYRKHQAAIEVLLPLGITMPTALIANTEDVDAFLEANAAKAMIVKPDNGTNGQGIRRVNRGEVASLFDGDTRLYGKTIMQPAYDFSSAFPQQLMPYDRASQEAFAGWNAAGVPKELRVYGFHSPRTTVVFPVGRAIEDGDNWFFVDPETVPNRVLDGTRQAIALAAEVSGAAALFGTVDYGYGSCDERPADWQAIEFNGRAPYMIAYEQHYDVADRLRDQFAEMILQTAVTSSASAR